MEIQTAYFLGAGASKALYPTLPLASEMTLEYLLDRRGSPVGSDGAIQQVEDYIAAQSWLKDKRRIPFEEIYPCFPKNEKPFYPRENLELCLFRKLRIDQPPVGGNMDSWLEKTLYSNCPVLTTNYDTVIEWHVENLAIGPVGFGDSGLVDYGVPDDLCLPLTTAGPRLDGRGERLLLLKLYGSISWSRCEECHKYLLERIHDYGADNAIVGRGKCGGCGGTRRGAVFVPLAGQKIPDDTALRTIWDRAEQALRQARWIVFAGFSLNLNDRSVRELLRGAFSAHKPEKVVVVLDRKNSEVLGRYEEIYGHRVELYDSGWQQYLEEQ